MASDKVLEELDPHNDPYGAFVRLWCADHSAWNDGLEDRAECERLAVRGLATLLTGKGDLGPIPVPAALRAYDLYLARIRPGRRSARRVTIDGNRSYWVVCRPPGWTTRFSADRSNYREHWARQHNCVSADLSGIKVRFVCPPRGPRLELPIPVLAGGFVDGVEPAWEPPFPPYRCAVLRDPGRRWASVERCLERARDRGTKILVLPELTIDAEVLQRICDWLKDESTHSLELVAAGSFHRSCEADGKVYNEGWLLGRRGDVLVVQRKIQPMRHGGKLGDELIAASNELRVMETPLGVVAVAICLDFCELERQAVGRLWWELAPDLVLVMSMGESRTNEYHKRRANDLFDQNGTRVFIASQHPDPRDPPHPVIASQHPDPRDHPHPVEPRAVGIACGAISSEVSPFVELTLV